MHGKVAQRSRACGNASTYNTLMKGVDEMEENMVQQLSIYDACACVEGFDGLEHTQEEEIAAWQYLIDTGAAWTLQGWYGRNAHALIKAGICRPALNV
jgi:hypothetical protein